MNLTIERGVTVPMRDGTLLRADVFRPNDGGCYPVLLERTPYGRQNFLVSGMPLEPIRAAATGYAVVIQDVRGRFDSAGDFYPFTNEAQDGYDTVEWCAEQSWSNGRVGMYGSSYMAASAWQAAAAKPPHLVTIVPSQASSDYYEGRSYWGGVFELGNLLTTSFLALSPGAIARLDATPDEKRTLTRAFRAAADSLDETARTLPLNGLRELGMDRAAPFFFDWRSHTTHDDYWQAISLEQSYGDVDIPMLHMTSWFDCFLPGSLRNYEGMTANARQPQRLIVGPWTHHVPMSTIPGSARVGDMNCGLGSMLDFDGVQLGWFDRWLKDDETALRGAPVRLFVMGANRWRDEETWPLPQATEQRLYLGSSGHANTRHGDGTLSRSEASTADYDRFAYDPNDPVPTLGGPHVMIQTSHPSGSFDQQRIEEREDVLVYTSEPLTEDIEVTGYVEAVLSVASSAPDTDFTAKLVDLHPDGRAFNICEGIQRLGQRAGNDPYAADDATEVTVRLGATSNAIKRGHCIRLDVSSSNFPRFDRNLNTGADSLCSSETAVARQTVLHSAAHPSFLRLPVVPTAS